MFRLALRLVLAIALCAAADSAKAQLSVSVNNHTCATLTVNLADAPGCGPHVAGCFAEARQGFTTKLTTTAPYQEGYFRLAAKGLCLNRNTALSGECLVQVKPVWKRVPGFGITVYRDQSGNPQSQTVDPPSNSPYRDLDVALPQIASLVTVEIYQGICEVDGGARTCEVFCRTSDQQ